MQKIKLTRRQEEGFGDGGIREGGSEGIVEKPGETQT
jgi:hypothetical protein